MSTDTEFRVAVLAELNRASVDPQCASYVRAIYREDAAQLRHELSLEGVDVPDAPPEPEAPPA